MSAKVMGNPLLKGVTVLLIFGVLLYVSNGSDKTPSNGQQENKARNDSNVVDTYTPHEELESVNGYLGNVEKKTEKLTDEMKSIQENMLSKGDITDIISQQLERISISNSANDVDLSQMAEEIKQQLISELSVGQVSVNQVESVDDSLFVDEFVVDDPDGQSTNDTSQKGRWVSALGHIEVDASEKNVMDTITSLNPFGGSPKNNQTSNKDKSLSQATEKDKKPKKIPYGTLHADSMILNVTNLNSLFGRIPRKQSTYEPYEFSLMLSGETLMANGFSFPEIRNATVSGYAIGDRSMTCVRGYVTHFTFIFSDGRIAQQKATSENPLAEIGDAWGNPCVRGVLVDDIKSHVLAQGLMGGLSKYGEVLSQQQQTTVSNGTQASTVLSGDASKQALGAIGSGGLDTTAAILAERYESYYEGVYVPQGQKLSLRLKENIFIDYDPEGRKVNYASEYNTSNLASAFD